MNKNAEVQDQAANAAKAQTDTKAAGLLGLDEDAVKKVAKAVAKDILALHKDDIPIRIVMSGGAGSGKTTFARLLSEELGVKNIDLDEYVPGGFTTDKDEYARRFNKSLYEVWDSVPPKKGWIIEHVEACNKDLVGLYSPNFAILVDPGLERVTAAAKGRADVADEKDPSHRIERGIQSSMKAKKQFEALRAPSAGTIHFTGFTLKSI